MEADATASKSLFKDDSYDRVSLMTTIVTLFCVGDSAVAQPAMATRHRPDKSNTKITKKNVQVPVHTFLNPLTRGIGLVFPSKL